GPRDSSGSPARRPARREALPRAPAEILAEERAEPLLAVRLRGRDALRGSGQAGGTQPHPRRARGRARDLQGLRHRDPAADHHRGRSRHPEAGLLGTGGAGPLQAALGLAQVGAVTRVSAPLLEIAGLSIRFGGLAALSEVDLAVGAGEIFALIGPHGAGKTTVSTVLPGLYRPTAGRVRFDGHDLLARAPHAVARLGVARTFQNTEVFRGLSPLGNALIGEHPRLRGSVVAAALGLPKVRQEEAWARARAHSLLVRVGLADAAE